MTKIYSRFNGCDVEFSPLPLLKRMFLAAFKGLDFQIQFNPEEFPHGLPAPLVYKISRAARKLWDDHRLNLGQARVRIIQPTESQQ